MLLHLGLHRFAPAFPNRQLDHEPSANPQNASYLAVASGLAAEWNAAGSRRLANPLQHEHANPPGASRSATANRRLNGMLTGPAAHLLQRGTGIGKGGQQFVVVVRGDALAHGVVKADDLQHAACRVVEQARFV